MKSKYFMRALSLCVLGTVVACSGSGSTNNQATAAVADLGPELPASVGSATLKSCDATNCTFSAPLTAGADAAASISYFIVPNQQWVSNISNYYQSLIAGNALVVSNAISGGTVQFTLPKSSYVGPTNPNVVVYACNNATDAASYACPSATNSYSIAGLRGAGSNDGFDLQGVTGLTAPVVAGQTISTTWTNATKQDPNAMCYIFVTNLAAAPALSNATAGYLVPCGSENASVTYASSVTLPTSPVIMVSACTQDSAFSIDTCPDATNTYVVQSVQANSGTAGVAPMAVQSPTKATLQSCSTTTGRCTFNVAWTNPTGQPTGTSYFIVPNQFSVGTAAYYKDLLAGNALVAAATTSSQQATFTVDRANVGPSTPNVQIFSCSGTSCPSATNLTVAGLPAVASTAGSDLLPVTAVAANGIFASHKLSATWTNPTGQDTNAYCYLNITGGVVKSPALQLCSAGAGSVTLDTDPGSKDPLTFSVVSCINDTTSGINTCPPVGTPPAGTGLLAISGPPAAYSK